MQASKDKQLESAITSAVTAAANAAVVQTDIGYIKKDIAEIKQAVRDMPGIFLTVNEFKEHTKISDDHEKRIRVIEENMWKWIGISSIATAVAMMVISYVLKDLLG